MEISAYMESVTAQRSLLLSEEEALEGLTTLSLETQEGVSEEDVFTYIEQNMLRFLQLIRYLSKEDQELLLSYYLLAKTQTTLAIIHRTTQTLCSFLIRKAVERVGTFILLGPPTPELMAEILTRNDLENLLSTPLSTIISMYEKTRSFQRLAELYGLHRPDVRRAMRHASHQLEISPNSQEKALGAYLQGLIEKASAAGQGFSNRKMAKSGHIYKQDSEILGMFRIDVSHPEFGQVFTSRANR